MDKKQNVQGNAQEQDITKEDVAEATVEGIERNEESERQE